MSTLDHIAFFRNRRDEVPNQELAQALAKKKDRKSIREIAEDVPQHSEKMLPAITAGNGEAFIDVLSKRLGELTASQSTRVRKVMKQASSIIGH